MTNISSKENMNVIMDIFDEILKKQNLKYLTKDMKQFTYNRCQWYHKNRLKYNGLKEMNKRVIQEGYSYLQNKRQQTANPNNLSNLHSKQGQDFELRLKDHQENFNTLINGNKPDEIDFTDNIEEETIDTNNMSYIMSQTLADREKELNNITNKYSETNKAQAEKWLNSEKPNIKLNIKEPVSLESDITHINRNENINNTQKKNRKVRFNDDINDTDFVNEIKEFIKAQQNNSIYIDIVDKLDAIVKNQTIIMKHLGIEKNQNPTSILKKS